MRLLPPALREQIEELDRLRTRDDAWQIPREEGEVLYQIAVAMRPTLIVEVGTSYGFSSLHWAAALVTLKRDGRVHTIDVNSRKAEMSRATFTSADVGHLIENHLGNARDVLPLIDGPIDIAFIDADKPACQAYFDLCWPKVRAGGCVITDNAVTHRKELGEYIRKIRSRPDASSVEVAVGNGFEWTIKI